MRLALLLGVALASFAAPAMAQVAANPVELFSNGKPMAMPSGGLPSSPSSAAAVACQGGTGSAITSITTTASVVCSAATGTRSFFRISDTSGTYAGTPLGWCTWDGSTPTATYGDFPLQGAGTGYDSSGLLTIPNGPITCVSASGTLAIKGTAIQSGAAP